MAVARVTKITASSKKNFDDAVQQGLERTAKTVRGISGLEIVSQKAKVENGKIAEYRVTDGGHLHPRVMSPARSNRAYLSELKLPSGDAQPAAP